MKILLWTASVIVVLALILVAAVKIFFPAEKVQQMIVENLEESLNRQVTVEKASVSIWGGIGLKLENLEVKNNPGFSHEDFFNLQALDVKLKFFPLLQGKFEFGMISLDGLTANLEKNESGELNFDDLGQQEGQQVDPAKGATRAPFIFDNLLISNSRLVYYDDSTNTTVTLGEMALKSSMTRNGFDDSYKASGQLKFDYFSFADSAKTYEFPYLTMQADMNMRLNMKTELLEINRIDIKLADLQGQLEGQLSSILTEPSADLNFRTKRFTVEQLLSLLPPDINPTLEKLSGKGDMFATASLNGQFGQPGKLDFSGKVSVDNVTLSMSNVNGDFSIQSGEINMHQKAANILFESCTFANEPVSIKVYIKDIFEPTINADLSFSANLKRFEDFNDDIQDLAGRIYGNLNIFSDIKNPQTTRIDGGLVVEDLLLKHKQLTRTIQEIDCEFAFNKTDITIDQFEAEIGSSVFSLSGDMNQIIPFLADQSDNSYSPMIAVNLDAQSFHLDELSELMPIDTQAVGRETARDSVMAVRFQKKLAMITARGNINIERGVYALVEFENFNSTYDLRDNILHFEQMNADVYDGGFQGEVIVDYEDMQNPAFSIDYTAEQIQINSFLSRVAGMQDIISGQAFMKSSFSGLMGTPEEVLDSLRANGTVTLEDGKLRNFQLLQQITDKLGFGSFKGEEIRNLNNTFHVEDGRLRFDQFSMALGQSAWEASGSVGFDGSLDYLVNVTIDKKMIGGSGPLSELSDLFGGGEVTLPLKLSGTYSDPEISVDRSKITKSADKRLKEEGRNLLDELLKKN